MSLPAGGKLGAPEAAGTERIPTVSGFLTGKIRPLYGKGRSQSVKPGEAAANETGSRQAPTVKPCISNRDAQKRRRVT
jgi:hypothetical protein